MAHSNRNKQKEKRKAIKAAIKASKRALYLSLAGKPSNKKKKRNRGLSGESGTFARGLALVKVKLNGVWTAAERRVHGGPDCHNIGCKRCSPIWRVA